MTGLWKSWNDPATRQPLETFTIITTDPNEVMEPLLGHPQIFSGHPWCLWMPPQTTALRCICNICGARESMQFALQDFGPANPLKIRRMNLANVPP
ncbi:SOS response-associated peptidase family protein [Tunturiibacter gelidiferens]|uniref:SOS response-associated peptidase family protein n=1 Tax=Tunturiibacter gelidiferens TaxID=3069689 RepID=UPI003C12C416